MNAAERIAIDQQLAGLKGAELATVASASLAACRDLECQTDVLSNALARAGSLVPQHVGEGARLALGTGSGALVGILRGSLGPLWGRVASAGPALVGLTLGVVSKDASHKAAGYSILGGASAGEAAVEMYDVGQILRAKLTAKVTIGKTTAQTPPPPPPPSK